MDIAWSHDQWATWLGGWNTLTLNHKDFIVIVEEFNNKKYICIKNWGKLLLQIGETFFNCKLRQTLLQNGTFSLLHIGASVATNWGSYYNLRQSLLKNRAAITNWDKI